jgi:hypothetical protein
MWRTSSKDTGTNATKEGYVYTIIMRTGDMKTGGRRQHSHVTEASFSQREFFVVFEKCLRDIDEQYSEDSSITSQKTVSLLRRQCHFSEDSVTSQSIPSIPSTHTGPKYFFQRKGREKCANARYEGLQSRLITLLPMFLYAFGDIIRQHASRKEGLKDQMSAYLLVLRNAKDPIIHDPQTESERDSEMGSSRNHNNALTHRKSILEQAMVARFRKTVWCGKTKTKAKAKARATHRQHTRRQDDKSNNAPDMFETKDPALQKY